MEPLLKISDALTEGSSFYGEPEPDEKKIVLGLKDLD